MRGVYWIFIDDYYYIGSSQNIPKRIARHLRELAVGKHVNKKLQSVFNKYNEFSYTFREVPDGKDLLEAEQRVLDQHIDDQCCCNLARSATAAFQGREHTKDSKERISDSSRAAMVTTTIFKEDGIEVLTSIGRAAKVLNVHASHIRQWATKRRPIPERFRIKGVSLLYPDGKYVSSFE
jgi:GIY-YIG catalytic domain